MLMRVGFGTGAGQFLPISTSWRSESMKNSFSPDIVLACYLGLSND
jgi:hypothetical protein